MFYHTIALTAGFLLDLLIGDPRWLYHPVCLIGNLIAVLEKGIQKNNFPKPQKGELLGGFLEVVLVCLLSFGIPAVILSVLYRNVPALGCAVEPSGVISSLLQNP